jgi:hypothetical protein
MVETHCARLVFWRRRGRISAGTQIILTEVFRGFTESLPGNDAVVPQYYDPFLPDTFGFINHSMLLTTSLNNQLFKSTYIPYRRVRNSSSVRVAVSVFEHVTFPLHHHAMLKSGPVWSA